MSKGRSRSSQRRKVEEGRRIAQEALGDAVRDDGPGNDAKYVPAHKSEPVPVKSETIGVLLIS